MEIKLQVLIKLSADRIVTENLIRSLYHYGDYSINDLCFYFTRTSEYINNIISKPYEQMISTNTHFVQMSGDVNVVKTKPLSLDDLQTAFNLLCNVNRGDLTTQHPEWQEAFSKFRERYHELIEKSKPKLTMVDCRAIAARIWCDPQYEHVVMDTNFCEILAIALFNHQNK